MRLAGNGSAEVFGRVADRQTGRRVANGFEKFKMAMRMARLAFGRRAEHGGYIIVALNIRLLSEIAK